MVISGFRPPSVVDVWRPRARTRERKLEYISGVRSANYALAERSWTFLGDKRALSKYSTQSTLCLPSGMLNVLVQVWCYLLYWNNRVVQVWCDLLYWNDRVVQVWCDLLYWNTSVVQVLCDLLYWNNSVVQVWCDLHYWSNCKVQVWCDLLYWNIQNGGSQQGAARADKTKASGRTRERQAVLYKDKTCIRSQG
ncbi:hypothetical protein PoB_000144900 [Plakobranchus ocellatus]|uniref:Uncharacterized protein n=1 Tax=Plakobranchus ocellatus TaxID=259542 RepID=A0AAV3XYC3_9GAST|nr:hypothetical protein PoB_000144900 [Plakobranchus ocellatus]